VVDTLIRLQAALASRYHVEREIGAGGMATVYLAQDLRHDRNVAVKVLRPELGALIGADRFLAEIKTTAHLQHPHILSLLDSGEAAGFLYYVMPYVEGESLRSRLSREHQLPIEDAVRIAREAADALDYAHRHGIIHRDIKPENILLTEEHALVADFGIARALDGGAGTRSRVGGQRGSGAEERLTETGLSLGTPAYMSPEQAAGERSLDGRTDIYSLGVVLYEMLAGEPPHTGPTAQAIMARRLSEAAPPVVRVRPAVPDSIDAALRRALAPVPADRFPRAIDFCRALTLPSAAVTIPSQPADATRVATPRISRTMLLGLGFLLGLGVLFGWLRSREARVPGGGGGSTRVAVLPFEILGDTSERAFGEGMSDELTTRLARVPGLSLVARSSALQYSRSGQTAPEFGRSLGVDYVLDGTVRSAPGAGGQKQLRITPELIKVADGTHVWGEPYDGSSGDVFRLQADVAERVAEALHGTLEGGAARAVRANPTTDLEAFRLYAMGRAEWNLRTPDHLQRAADYFRQAIARDSNYARAWAGLADAYALFDYYGVRSPPRDSSYALAKAAALRAIALDSTLAEPHASLNQILRYGYWDWAGSEREIRRAIQLDPNYATAHKWLAEHLLSQGRIEEAIAEARIATQLDPLADQTQLVLGLSLWFGGRATEGEEVLQRALDHNPSSATIAGNLLGLYLMNGRSEDAAALLARYQGLRMNLVRVPHENLGLAIRGLHDPAARRLYLDRIDKYRPPLPPFDRARSYALFEDWARALPELERAVLARDPRLEFIKVDPSWSGIRNDPRFTALVRRMGLMP
jgi:eukaryotic-like serine/threonine-protein kinase